MATLESIASSRVKSFIDLNEGTDIGDAFKEKARAALDTVFDSMMMGGSSIIDEQAPTRIEKQIQRLTSDLGRRLDAMWPNGKYYRSKDCIEPVPSMKAGKDAELRLYEQMSEAKPPGWDIKHVSDIFYSCDILVKVEGKPDVRIECKAWNSNISYKEVKKFYEDLAFTNDHGILVSLYSGVETFEYNHALHEEPNGRFAVILSENQFDVDVIFSYVNLIHLLDAAFEKRNSPEKVRIERTMRLLIQEVFDEYDKDFKLLNMLIGFAPEEVKVTLRKHIFKMVADQNRKIESRLGSRDKKTALQRKQTADKKQAAATANIVRDEELSVDEPVVVKVKKTRKVKDTK